MVEIRRGLLVLEWAFGQVLWDICIRTDCAAFVQGLLNPADAEFTLQTALLDFCSLCTHFNVVKVVKVDRQVVQAAHVKARAALLNL
ncbi:hypothetical protein RHMOL_Rhmol10G0055700 [Rhododendron molle]|uniref:Uncharacterized protein n=1 Tax=Rhododendron molle TaxID=49168 RepID=A0ACC0LZD1_RHOML|nr:hypothetical protein RHMOL_Rhmol10G0055700 [Rhododendron molle]